MNYEPDSKLYDQYIELESKIVKLENEISDLKTNKKALVKLANQRYDIIDSFASEIASLKAIIEEQKQEIASLKAQYYI